MKFCINFEDPLGLVSYRLQTNQYWQPCDDSQIKLESDFETESREVILNIQKSDVAITIDDESYIINSSMGSELFSNDLFYAVYGFRDVAPANPIRNQLETLLVNGDDSQDNTLILKTDGRFYLVEPRTIIFQKVDPDIVLQFSGFQAGNGYVGPTIKNSKFDQYSEDYFRTGMHFWRDHLIYKKLHERTDDQKGTTIDELLDIYDDIRAIEW